MVLRQGAFELSCFPDLAISDRCSGRMSSGEQGETAQRGRYGQGLGSGPFIFLVYRNGTERASTGFDGLIFSSRRVFSKYLPSRMLF